MPDEIPVCDVLLQAAEYLTKLGSNLKLRTESLKEKRINKSKLRNTHAVQKAADKLLLICELSKKSLVNVEDSVKNILNVCEENTNKSSTKYGTHSSGKPEAKTHIFKYRSQTLRINEKVPLKHYTSVRVLARKMSSSMIDKYPVYYNCKLYRNREKREQKLNNNESTEFEQNSVENNDLVINKSGGNIGKASDDLKPGTTPEQNANPFVAKIPENIKGKSELSDVKKCLLESSGDEDKETIIDKKRKKKGRTIDSTDGSSCDETDKNNSTKENLKAHSKNLDSEKSNQKSEESSLKQTELAQSVFVEEQAQCILEESDDSKSIEINKKSTKISKESSLEQKEQFQSDLEESNNSKSVRKNANQFVDKIPENIKKNSELSDVKKCLLESSGDEDEETIIDNKRKKKGRTIDSTYGSSGDEPDKNNLTKENINSKNLDSEKSNPKSKESSLEQTEQVHSDLEESHNLKSFISKNSSSDESKPLIKCIDINKLLKPDAKKYNSEGKIKKSVTFIISDDEDEDDIYWKEKRQEVKAFVSKTFSVKVQQLPELNEEFMHSTKLNRITKMCKVVVELEKNTLDSAKSNSDNDEKNTERTSKKLRDLQEKRKENNKNISSSDSESNTKEKILNNEDQKKIKKSESENITQDISKEGTDSKNKEADQDKESNGNKNSNETDDLIEKTPEKEMTKSNMSPKKEDAHINDIDEDSNVKNSLLNESSGSTPKGAQNKRKRSGSSTQQPKRKHIMESMKAKRMLLTYSSSSDTENEQLKSAVKEIKESLLAEDIISNEVKEVIKGKLLESSSSDESPVKRNKKAKKIVSDKSDDESKDSINNCSIGQVDGAMDENSTSSQVRFKKKVEIKF